MSFFKILSILIFSVCFLSFNAQQKILKSTDEAKMISNRAILHLKKGNINLFFRELRPYSLLSDIEFSKLEKGTANQIKFLQTKFGKLRNITKAKEETVKELTLIDTYLLYFQKSTIKLRFVFFQNRQGWIIHKLNWEL